MEVVSMDELKKEAQIEIPANIYEKLSRIQCELRAPKNQFNNYGNYKYRSCEDVLEAVKPICQKYRTTLIISDSIKYTEGRFYVMATVELRDWDSDYKITNTAYAREADSKKGMDTSQVTGSTSTYARKYALNGLFCIDDTKDTDTNHYEEEARNRQKEQQKKDDELAKEWKEWSDNRYRMDELGIDYRSNEVTQWINSHTGVADHSACDDVETMKKINMAYKTLIKGRLDRLEKQREQDVAAV